MACAWKRTTLGISPHLLLCLRQSLLCSAVQVRVSGLLASGDFPVLTFHLTVGVLGLPSCTSVHLGSQDRTQALWLVYQMLYTLSHYLSPSQVSYTSSSVYFFFETVSQNWQYQGNQSYNKIALCCHFYIIIYFYIQQTLSNFPCIDSKILIFLMNLHYKQVYRTTSVG